MVIISASAALPRIFRSGCNQALKKRCISSIGLILVMDMSARNRQPAAISKKQMLIRRRGVWLSKSGRWLMFMPVSVEVQQALLGQAGGGLVQRQLTVGDADNAVCIF